MSLVILLAAALLLVGAIAGLPRWRAWRRRVWSSRPFPAAWRNVLRRRVPLYRQLPPDLQLQLRRRILEFLAEKPFLGCAGLVVTDEMRVTIAAQASLLRLNRAGPMFPELRQVLVYPGAFLVDRVHAAPGGVLREERRALAGESWQQGQVILSWQDVLDGARIPDDGHNVVLHEFAHQLDQETGPANGAPLLGSRAAHARWADVMSREFAGLQARMRARDAARARAQAEWSWFGGSPDTLPPPPARGPDQRLRRHQRGRVLRRRDRGLLRAAGRARRAPSRAVRPASRLLPGRSAHLALSRQAPAAGCCVRILWIIEPAARPTLLLTPPAASLALTGETTCSPFARPRTAATPTTAG